MQKVVLILLILCAAFNSAQLTLSVLDHQLHPSKTPLHSLSDRFKGLEDVLNNQRTVGYYTDKDIDIPVVVAQFEQAQYVLAPTVLKLNETQYPFVLFDCSSPEVAVHKMKELGLQPIKANNFGIILAVNPNALN